MTAPQTEAATDFGRRWTLAPAENWEEGRWTADRDVEAVAARIRRAIEERPYHSRRIRCYRLLSELGIQKLSDVMRAAGPCHFVDPYCREPRLNERAKDTEAARVLIGPKVDPERFDLTLGNIRPPRAQELHISPNIHDRYVIPDDGQVPVLGTAPTGIGKSKPSVLVHLDVALSGTIRQVHEEVWTRARKWAPPRRS